MNWSLYPVVPQVQSGDLQTGLPRGVHYKQKMTPRGKINHDLDEGKINLNGQDKTVLELKEKRKSNPNKIREHPFFNDLTSFLISKTVRYYHVLKKYKIYKCNFTFLGIFFST